MFGQIIFFHVFLFYLFDANTIDDLYNSPIAQIKFMDDDKTDMFIRRLEFIDNNFKGKGYASALIKCFELYSQNNNYKNIVGELVPLHNEPAEKVTKYYLKNGFEIKTDQNNEPHIFKKIKNINTKIVEGVQIIDNDAFAKQEEMQM